MEKPTWAIVGIAVIIAIIAGIAIGGNTQPKDNPDKISISGTVSTITPDTKPIRLDFINQGSNEKLSATLNENNMYSINLDSGKYSVELIYSARDVISPLPGNCGIFEFDTDNNAKDFKC